MTKKDYKIIAGILNEAYEAMLSNGSDESLQLIHSLSDAFIIELKRDNPRFDPGKFREAVFGKDGSHG